MVETPREFRLDVTRCTSSRLVLLGTIVTTCVSSHVANQKMADSQNAPAPAPAAATEAKDQYDGVKVFRFVGKVAKPNFTFNCQITFLKGSFMIWVGPATEAPALSNMVRQELDDAWNCKLEKQVLCNSHLLRIERRYPSRNSNPIFRSIDTARPCRCQQGFLQYPKQQQCCKAVTVTPVTRATCSASKCPKRCLRRSLLRTRCQASEVSRTRLQPR